jgi:hypothetical protein
LSRWRGSCTRAGCRATAGGMCTYMEAAGGLAMSGCLFHSCLCASQRGAPRSGAGGGTCRRTSAPIPPSQSTPIDGTPSAIPRRIRGGRRASSAPETYHLSGHRRLVVEHDNRRRLHMTTTTRWPTTTRRTRTTQTTLSPMFSTTDRRPWRRVGSSTYRRR